MKHTLTLRLWGATTLLLITFSPSGYADEVVNRVNGKIDAVTLYTDRALVRRVYDASKEQASGIVRFKELPQSIMSDTVRAQGEGVTITSVSLKTAIEDENKDLEEHPLKIKIDDLAEQRKAVNDDINNYNEQLRLINSYMRLSTTETDKDARNNSIKVENWNTALQFIETKRLYYQEKIRQANLKINAIQKEINTISRQFERLTRARKFSNYEVEVSFTRSPSAKSKIFLDYMVANVSWTGHYDLRGSSEGSEFKMVSHAAIRQTTGEEWTSALITLSTARPSYAVNPSPLRPWRLNADSLNSLGGDSNKGNLNDLDEDINRQEGGESSSADSSDTTTLTIELPHRENIASDNSEHKVTLNNSDLKGALTHVAIPSVSNFVYLKAKLKNSSGMPILWSKMNIFLDGNFVGASHLTQRTAAGEEFEVFLGPDQRLQLKRVLKKGEVGSSGLFNKTVDINNEWQIEIANYTKKNRQILIYDQYPIPADPKISTKFLGSNRSDVQADANGILTWKLDIKANENIKIDFSYSLSIPNDIWEKFVNVQKQRDSLREQNQMESNMMQQRKNAPVQYNLEKMLMKK